MSLVNNRFVHLSNDSDLDLYIQIYMRGTKYDHNDKSLTKIQQQIYFGTLANKFAFAVFVNDLAYQNEF